MNISPSNAFQQPSQLHYFDQTALSYYSTLFRYWRGEIDVEVEIIATQMHQGQLFLSFQPGGSKPAKYSESINTLCATIDIGQQNTTLFSIPWVSVEDYKVTGTDYGTLDTGGATGTLALYIQNALVAPPSVSNTISINIWIKAGKNFEFIFPRQPSGNIFYDGRWQPYAYPKNAVDGVVYDEEVGEWQSEVISNEETHVAPGTNMVGQRTVNPITPITIIATADTSNIVGREYLNPDPLIWKSTSNQGDFVLSMPMPSTFLKLKTAVGGLCEYHYLFRSGFKIKFKLASSRFYSGLLLIYYDPFGEADTAINTCTQLPHTFLNIGYQTEAEIIIPWTFQTRVAVADSSNNMGTVFVRVVNSLQPPPSGVAQVTASIWFSPLNPYIGVKTVQKPYDDPFDLTSVA